MMTSETCDLLGSKKLIEDFLKKHPRELSAFSFVNIFAWRDFFDFELKIINGKLCIFARDRLGCFLYLPPLGENVSRETVDACFGYMYSCNQGKGVSRIENVPKEDLGLFDKNVFSVFEKSGEYIYRRENMASLKGNLLKSQRSLYNRFVKSYRHEFLSFVPGMREKCLRLFDAWASQRMSANHDPVYREMIKQNRLVHQTVLAHCEEIGVIGRVVCMDGEIKAYTFGFALNQKTFCVLFEIADLSLKGLPVYIFKEFCGDYAVGNFSHINVMDDFGLDNIKRTKLSFRPCDIIASYVVSKK